MKIVRGEQYFTCGFAYLGELPFVGHKILFESIWGHNRAPLEQLFTLYGSNVAHGSEAVGLVGCGLFKGVFRLHIELARHLVAIIRTEIIIQRFAVAAYAAAYTCCVGGEYGRYRREHILYIQQTHGRRPFVEVALETVCSEST